MKLHNLVYKLINYLYNNAILIYIIVRLNAFIKQFNIKISADQHIISSNTVDRIIYTLLLKFKLWDRELINFVNKYTKKGMTVIDVGANIGVYTLYFSKLVRSEGNVYSFEPAEGNYNLLQNNIQLNNCNNVTTYYNAVYKKNTIKNYV